MLGALSDERTSLSFSGPSPVGLVTIFYCLRFETSFSVASYDTQGYGGGIRLRLHTGLPILASILPFITPLHGPSIKRRFQHTSIVACVSVAVGTVPLPRNGFTRYNIHDNSNHQTHSQCSYPYREHEFSLSQSSNCEDTSSEIHLDNYIFS
jgi:hypothetical protein